MRNIYGLRFSADGRTLFAAIDTHPAGYHEIQRFDARSGRPLDTPRPVGRGVATVNLMITRDGRRVVTSLRERRRP